MLSYADLCNDPTRSSYSVVSRLNREMLWSHDTRPQCTYWSLLMKGRVERVSSRLQLWSLLLTFSSSLNFAAAELVAHGLEYQNVCVFFMCKSSTFWKMKPRLNSLPPKRSDGRRHWLPYWTPSSCEAPQCPFISRGVSKDFSWFISFSTVLISIVCLLFLQS